jgi:hypothetical protein
MLSKATKAMVEGSVHDFMAGVNYITTDWPWHRSRIGAHLWSYARNIAVRSKFEPGREFDGLHVPEGIARFIAYKIVACYQDFGHNPEAIRYFGTVLKDKVGEFQKILLHEREQAIEARLGWINSEDPVAERPAEGKYCRQYELLTFPKTDLGSTVKQMILENK